MAKKRLFIGIFTEKEIFKGKYSKIKKEFGGILPGRWIKPENFHITLKFIGNVEEEKIPEIQKILEKYLDKLEDLNIEIKGLGAFPNIKNPKILFAKVEDKDGILKKLNAEIEEKLQELGIKKELKPFTPHITLKRIKEVNVEKFIEKVKKFENLHFGKQKKGKINLIESITAPKGAVYKIIKKD